MPLLYDDVLFIDSDGLSLNIQIVLLKPFRSKNSRRAFLFVLIKYKKLLSRKVEGTGPMKTLATITLKVNFGATSCPFRVSPEIVER